MKASLAASRPLVPVVYALRSGSLPLADHVRSTLDRIERTEGVVRALLPEAEREARLLRDAASLESRFPDPAERPALYGAMLGVKDLFNADGLETRAGSRLPPETFAGAESPVVSALKRAGALVLGKTVTTEFAYFSPGPTRNPRDSDHTPGGSSSGSAAAVASGICQLAIGTQTIGSIGRPAAYCGVAGWKPSYERVSREGAVPFSPSVDHVGLFSADVPGIAAAAPYIAAGWKPFAAPASKPAIAIPDGAYLSQAEPGMLAALDAVAARLEARGYAVARVPAFADIEAINARHRLICAAELAKVHARWFSEYGELYSAHTRELIATGVGVEAVRLGEALAGRFALREALESAMRRHGIDLWLSPSAIGIAPEGIDSTGSPIMNLPWTHAGLPTLTLRSGVSLGTLPYGVQFAARFGADEALLYWGAGIEAILDGTLG
jgi:Asp-tRNA(Asn)/Glu-tRNA(Gln) amidotransferase A subunit family amidase